MPFTLVTFDLVTMWAGFYMASWSLIASVAWLGLMIVALSTMYIRLRRGIRREFEAAGGRLCTHCGYNLWGLPDRGGCPECGHEFDAEFDANTWGGAGFVARAVGSDQPVKNDHA